MLTSSITKPDSMNGIDEGMVRVTVTVDVPKTAGRSLQSAFLDAAYNAQGDE